MPVSWEEMEGSPRISFAEGRFSASRRFKITWNDWPAFAVELYGGYRFDPDTSKPVFFSPATFPGVPSAVVQDVDIEGFPQNKPGGFSSGTSHSDQVASYAFAIVNARYAIVSKGNDRSDLPGTENGTFLQYQGSSAVEILNHTPDAFQWKTAIGGSKKLARSLDLGLRVPTGGFTLRWSRVIRPPFGRIKDTLGKLNNATYLGFPAGTVLFAGESDSRSFQMGLDENLWTLEYRFLWTRRGANDRGWNYAFRREASGGDHWQEIEDKTGNPPFESADFTLLTRYE